MLMVIPAPVKAALFLVASLILAVVGLTVPHYAAAAEESAPAAGEVALSLAPIGQTGSYVDVTLEPGETLRVGFDLANKGADELAALTYAADAYSLVNGGFGAKERGSEPTGTTTWLTYATEVMTLAPGTAVERQLDIAVPDGTGPGVYLAAVVLENNEPVSGSGDVAIDQIVRQAVAVSITVPGPEAPALALGDASHTLTAGRSVVEVGVVNGGNTTLRPTGDLTIADASGAVVSQAPIAMGSLFAGSETLISSTLAEALIPGEYTVTVTVGDAGSGTTASASDLTFTVAETAVAPRSEGFAQALPPVLQGDSSTPVLVGLGVVLAALVLVTGAAIITVGGGRAREQRSPHHGRRRFDGAT